MTGVERIDHGPAEGVVFLTVVVQAPSDPRHIVDLRADGWTIKHPQECRDGDLFACQVTKAAERDLDRWGPVGKFYCEVSDTGSFALLSEVPE